ncbi:amidohydrolase [Salimicrobium sp. PL1-032A]|uniref:amidohydrolase n=1 Tax=Salimicrobium sp. PL1-032A TaxID=3095364 RepID=UPI0032603D35
MQTMYFGGNILTMEEDSGLVEAVLVENGRIQKTGTRQEVEEATEASEVEKVDLKGQTLMPSFIDAHSHITYVGPVSQMADLSGCMDFDEVVETLHQYITTNNIEAGAAVIGFGYDHTLLKEEDHPRKEVLNRLPENPVFVFHASAHMGCANDFLLEKAGIDADTEDVEGGAIGRVEASCEPDGFLEETSLTLIQPYLFAHMDPDYMKLLEEGQRVYIKNGITTAQDGATPLESVELCRAFAEQNRFHIDVIAYPMADEEPEKIFEAYPRHANTYHRRFKLGGYKMFLDGTPQGKTAWLTEPYEGETEYRGNGWYKDEQVKRFTDAAVQNGVQLLAHCNGDAASDQLLQSYRDSVREAGESEDDLRPVMIHAQTVRDDQLESMKQIGMIPSMFIDHTYYWGDVHLNNLGEKRGTRISPARSAIDKGLMVNFHQDSPVIEPDMFQTIWSAVNRMTRNGTRVGTEQRVSVYEALQAVTINAAFQYKEEVDKGSISEGKYADFIIVDRHPLDIDPSDLREIQVVETIKEGRTIYREGEFF